MKDIDILVFRKIWNIEKRLISIFSNDIMILKVLSFLLLIWLQVLEKKMLFVKEMEAGVLYSSVNFVKEKSIVIYKVLSECTKV